MKHEQPRMIEGMPEGGLDAVLEHDLWMSMLDYTRRHGYAKAREKVAELLTELAQGKRQ